MPRGKDGSLRQNRFQLVRINLKTNYVLFQHPWGVTEEMKELCWLKPKLVAQINFTEWTNCDLLRHAASEGLRDDKEPRSVVREVAAG
jgi:ATP-dependent DNA ligase